MFSDAFLNPLCDEDSPVGRSCIDFSQVWYSIISKICSGLLLDVITVATPAAVAISAAINLVSIPPVPRLDPSVDVLTVVYIQVRFFDQHCDD
jgi:hypothetical protein